MKKQSSAMHISIHFLFVCEILDNLISLANSYVNETTNVSSLVLLTIQRHLKTNVQKLFFSERSQAKKVCKLILCFYVKVKYQSGVQVPFKFYLNINSLSSRRCYRSASLLRNNF